MVCQITAGSLPLSAISALLVTMSALPRLEYYPAIPHRCGGLVNGAHSATPQSLLQCGKPCHTGPASRYHSRGSTHVNALAHQPPQIISANGIDLCYEIFGDPAAEPLLLIMGLRAQMIHWDDDFCRQLAARGFRVIRFDNRDIGKSSKLTGGKRLSPFELIKLRFLKIPVAAPYRLPDMAQDVGGLM